MSVASICFIYQYKSGIEAMPGDPVRCLFNIIYIIGQMVA